MHILLTRRRPAQLRLFALVTTVAFAHLLFLPACSSLAEAAEQRIRYFHPDHLGSTALVTDENGRVIERIAYKPFGEVYRREVRDPTTGQLIVGNMAPSVSPYGFTGQRHDTDTGLYFYGSRYYDPQLGRFIQPDTLVQAPTDPQTLNRYSYVRNNPVKYVDPSGHLFFLVGFLIAIAISVATEFAIQAFNMRGAAANALRFAGAIAGAGVGGSMIGLTGRALGNAIGAAGATSLTLNTGEGRQLTKSVSKKFEQMGLSPRAAAIAGAAVTSTVVSAGYGAAFSSLTAPPGITNQQITSDQWASDPRYAELRAGQGTSEGSFWGRGSNISDTAKAPHAKLFEFSQNGRVVGVLSTAPLFGDVPILGHLARFLQINHSAFVGYKSTGGIVSSMIPIGKVEYATTTVCHTCTLIAGVNAGTPVPGLLTAIGPSSTISSMLYGLYGGATAAAAATAAAREEFE